MATVLRRTPGKHRAGRGVFREQPRGSKRKAPQPLPAIVAVCPEVLGTIAAASTVSARRETGGPLVGTVQRSWSGTEAGLLVSVLGTVPPPAAPRSGESWVGLGRTSDGERSASALRWWRAVTRLNLRHLGDWHKHYSGIPEPSEGDRRTAAEMATGSSVPVWLVAVTVADRHGTEHLEAAGHVVRLTQTSTASNEVRFYRQVDGWGLVPLAVHADGQTVPGLPPLPWHVTDAGRFAVECRLLGAAGFSVAIDPVRPDGKLGLALRLARDGDRPLTVLTGLRYPREALLTVDQAGRAKVRTPWGPERFLVDLAEEVSR